MEEIINRFEIVRFAVKISDHGTIAMQARKLRKASVDNDLGEVISLLESRNYRQALASMREYLDSLDDDFFDNVPKVEPKAKEKEKAEEPLETEESHESANLFDIPLHTEKVIDLEEMMRLTQQSAAKTVHHIDPEGSLGAIDEPIVEELNDSAEDLSKMSKKEDAEIIEEATVEIKNIEDEPLEKTIILDEASVEGLDNLEESDISLDSEDQGIQYFSDDNNELEIEKESMVSVKEDYIGENKKYPLISYIDQKFRNMRHQFPQIEEQGSIIPEVEMLLMKMSTDGYRDSDIKEAVKFFQQKKAEGNIIEAAQMLLLVAASESQYAQLLLARELFKGEVLQVDYPEAFTQINRLAEHDYPDAICDLAQLYEYGYGIKKDIKTAKLLYEEAAEMGVQRAEKHVARLSSKKGIFGFMFK